MYFTKVKSPFLPLLLLAALCTVSCIPRIDAIEPDIQPTAFDATRMMVVGDGFAAGYTNGGLFPSAQENSFPNIMVQQFVQASAVGSAFTFRQPLLPGNGSGFLRMTTWSGGGNCPTHINLPTTTFAAGSNGWGAPVYMQGPFENVAIPALRASQILHADSLKNNKYWARIVPNPQETSLISYIESFTNSSATSFILWLGTDEILEKAATGRIRPQDFPTQESLRAQFTPLVRSLISIAESGGLVATIPNIRLFPFFSTQRDSFYDPITCQPQPIFLRTETGLIRHVTTKDIILLSAVNILGTTLPNGNRYGLSPEAPLAAQYTLDEGEIPLLMEAIDRYNIAIMEAIEPYNGKIAAINLNPMLQKLAQGMTVDGLKVSSQYLLGDVFDIEGKHFTPRGNALIANEFIRACNQSLSTKIPMANIAEREGTIYP